MSRIVIVTKTKCDVFANRDILVTMNNGIYLLLGGGETSSVFLSHELVTAEKMLFFYFENMTFLCFSFGYIHTVQAQRRVFLSPTFF